MNDREYRLIGESLWNSYHDIAIMLYEAGLMGAPKAKGLRRWGLRAAEAKLGRKLGPKMRKKLRDPQTISQQQEFMRDKSDEGGSLGA